MLNKLYKPKNILLVILLLSAFLRLHRLDYPKNYVFDEVYHAYTAKEYLKGNKDAWSPWGKATEVGTAFEWLHPPVAKEIMTFSMLILHTNDAWSWRLPGVIFGVLSIYLVYILALLLFKNQITALLSAFIFSLDGLVFVQSRTGMNDVYLVAFILFSIISFVRKKYLFSALLLGISTATKWPGVFLYFMFIPILFANRQFKEIIYFLLLPPIIYLLSYTHYFLIGYRLDDFIELHRQIWWYQTNLKATHTYSSPWWSWPLNFYPIWYFVDYQKNMVANIFASGNPAVFWIGTASIILTVWEFVKKRSKNLLIIVLGFLVFWLPWAISPRIMFLYHFSPSVPFLCLSLGYQLNVLINEGKRKTVLVIIGLIILTFILIFPFLTGIPLPKNLVNLFFLTNLSKNPF